jgi:hypothetical protein
MNIMKRYIIERDIPGIGAFSVTELCGAARASNWALATIGNAIQWQHSYVAGNKTFCVYLADGEAAIKKHADLSGIPFSTITEVSQINDPVVLWRRIAKDSVPQYNWVGIKTPLPSLMPLRQRRQAHQNCVRIMPGFQPKFRPPIINQIIFGI